MPDRLPEPSLATLALCQRPAWHLRPEGGDGTGPADELLLEVAVECPVSLSYGAAALAVPHVVIMASPVDIEELVLGYSLSEGIIEHAGQLTALTVQAEAGGITAVAGLAGPALHRLLERRRRAGSRSSCGVCGVETLADLPQARPRPGPPPSFDPRRLPGLLAALEHAQALHSRTRSLHAAAWFDHAGALVALREDVGRHNALDKLIGALARAGIDPGAGTLVITSRCSFEMIEKAAAAGMRLMVALSAPTGLAIERAHALGLTLIARARPDGALLFAPMPAGAGSPCRPEA